MFLFSLLLNFQRCRLNFDLEFNTHSKLCHKQAKDSKGHSLKPTYAYAHTYTR